jgi:hypothetical protein
VRVLIGCEFSGIVREAFRRRGHDAWSCDLLPAEDGSPFHIQGDVRGVMGDGWDLGIFHPHCTYLTNSGVRWLYSEPLRWQKLIDGAVFFRELLAAPIPRIAVENPIMHGWARKIVGRGPDQIIQPHQFGHGETKATGLHLVNLPRLKPTNIVSGRTPRVHYASPGPDRWRERSRTLPGIAAAFAEQWGALERIQRVA